MDHFPHLHPRPATGWVNDPNGIGHWNGLWHVMMQWNPHASTWGDIHWAHLTSPDLVTWTERPAALTPRPGGLDAGGAWSGVAAVDDDGRRILVYSATPAGPDEIMQVIARPAGDAPDSWEQPDTAVLPPLTREGLKDVRDPFLFRHEGRRLAILGSRVGVGEAARGAVLLMDAADLDEWRPLGTLFAHDQAGDAVPDELSFWECPQLVRIDDSWVLVISWATLGDGTIPTQTLAAAAFAGDLEPDGESYRFVPRTTAPLDYGPDFYAPQLVDAGDRVLAFGWSWEGRGAHQRGDAEIERSGWAGTLTFPREVLLDDAGVPISRPVPELAALRDEALPTESDGHAFRTEEVAWMATIDGTWSLVIDGPEGSRDVLTDQVPGEIWVDGSIVEAYSPAGSSTIRAYPGPGEAWMLTATASITPVRLAPPR